MPTETFSIGLPPEQTKRVPIFFARPLGEPNFEIKIKETTDNFNNHHRFSYLCPM
jgi:hypothetical protein